MYANCAEDDKMKVYEQIRAMNPCPICGIDPREMTFKKLIDAGVSVNSGSTYVPLSQLVAHLPDDTDY